MIEEQREVIKLLCEFFFEEFANDPAGIGDWLSQGGNDPDEIIPKIEALQAQTSIQRG